MSYILCHETWGAGIETPKNKKDLYHYSQKNNLQSIRFYYEVNHVLLYSQLHFTTINMRTTSKEFGRRFTGTNVYQLCVDQTLWMCVDPSPPRLQHVGAVGRMSECLTHCIHIHSDTLHMNLAQLFVSSMSYILCRTLYIQQHHIHILTPYT